MQCKSIGDRGARLKRLLKERLDERWWRRLHALSRLRWVAKYRILRQAGVSPAAHLRYVLFDPEVESYTYRVANIDGMLAAIAQATGVPTEKLAGYVAEADADPEFGDRLSRRLRWRFDLKHRPQLANRLGWYVLIRALRPELALETGIYHGLGSLVLLRAMDRNAAEGTPGEVISFDSSPRTGWLVDRGRYPGWRHVVGMTPETLEPAVQGRRVGALFQDSDHSERTQQLEFGAALANAASTLVLVDGSAGQSPILEQLSRKLGAEYGCVSLGATDHWYQKGALAFAVFRANRDD